MRRALWILFAVSPFAVGCAEEQVEPQTAPQPIVTPADVAYARGGPTQPTIVYVREPLPDTRTPESRRVDPVWQVPTYYVPPPSPEYEIPPPHPIPRHTISLGFIGDWPLGSSGDPPAAPWWRPFPAAWERRFHGYGYGYGAGYTVRRRRWR